jgi:hypothetical protein
VIDAAQKIYAEEGMKAFWKGATGEIYGFCSQGIYFKSKQNKLKWILKYYFGASLKKWTIIEIF